MLSKSEIITKALELGFDDVGFTTAAPFERQREVLLERRESYAHLMTDLDLIGATDPKNVMPEAKSIIVLTAMYVKESFNPQMEAHFGRLYIDEDRIFKNEMVRWIKEFVGLLRENGMQAKASCALPHRACAGRAGVGSVGKNCLMHSRKPGCENSWMTPQRFWWIGNTNRTRPATKRLPAVRTGAGTPASSRVPPGPCRGRAGWTPGAVSPT